MKPLILTGWFTPEFTSLADLVVWFPSRFVWGPLPSPDVGWHPADNDRLWTYDPMLVKPKRRRRAP
jgi:hypothetical protein